MEVVVGTKTKTITQLQFVAGRVLVQADLVSGQVM